MSLQTPRAAPAILATAAVAVAIWGEVLLGGSTFARGDYREETVPARVWAAERIADGELPAWWDGVGLGVPYAANPRHAALYPVALPLALAPRAPAIDIWLILHLAWLAGGIALLARRFGADPLASVIAGAAAAAGGAATSALASGAIAGLSWTPWALVAADRLALAGPLRAPRGLLALAAAAAALAMQIFAGGLWLAPATALLAHALIAGRRPVDVDVDVDVDAHVDVDVVVDGDGDGDGDVNARRSLRTHAHLLLSQAFALLCAAAVLVPALALGSAGHPLGPIPTARAIELLWPGISGDPSAAAIPLGSAGPLPASPHIGLAILGLAALTFSIRRLRPLAIASAALIVAAFAASADLLPPAAITLAALAAVGLGRVIAARFGRNTAIGALAAVALSAAALIIASMQPSVLTPVLAATAPDAARHALISGATAVGLLVALLIVAVVIARAPRRHGWAVPLFGALLVGGAVAHAWQVMPRIDRGRLAGRPALLDFEADAEPEPRIARPPLSGDRTPADDAAERAERARETAIPNLGAEWELAHLRGRDRARQPIIDRAWAAAAASGERLLDLWDVAYVVLPASVAVPLGLPVVGEDAGEGAVVVHNVDRRPRAFVARRWEWRAGLEEVVDALFTPGPQPTIAMGTVQLLGEGDAAPAGAESSGPLPPLPCTLAEPRPERAEMTCTSVEGGYAVLLDAHADGWRATVDGEAETIVVADGLARAVKVGPGEHAVVMEYRVPGLRAGAVVSILGWAALGVLVAPALVRRRRSSKSKS